MDEFPFPNSSQTTPPPSSSSHLSPQNLVEFSLSSQLASNTIENSKTNSELRQLRVSLAESAEGWRDAVHIAERAHFKIDELETRLRGEKEEFDAKSRLEDEVRGEEEGVIRRLRDELGVERSEREELEKEIAILRDELEVERRRFASLKAEKKEMVDAGMGTEPVPALAPVPVSVPVPVPSATPTISPAAQPIFERVQSIETIETIETPLSSPRPPPLSLPPQRPSTHLTFDEKIAKIISHQFSLKIKARIRQRSEEEISSIKAAVDSCLQVLSPSNKIIKAKSKPQPKPKPKPRQREEKSKEKEKQKAYEKEKEKENSKPLVQQYRRAIARGQSPPRTFGIRQTFHSKTPSPKKTLKK